MKTLGTLILFAALAGIIYGIYRMIRPGNRKRGLWITVISFVMLLVGGAVVPTPETADNESNENNEETEENNDNNSNNLTENDSDNSNDNDDEHVEHQEGLTIDETGIVEDNQDQKYEITLNSVEYVDKVRGMESLGETYAVVNMTVKNLREESFDAKNIFRTSFGPEEALQASLNTDLMDEDLTDEDAVEQDLLEGEVAPGESVSGDHVFVVDEKVDNYVFAIGGKGDQIITYAQWEVPESELE